MADISANPIKLSRLQADVLLQIADWFLHKTAEQKYLTLGGYAGTGKTTLLGIFSRKLRDKHPNIKIAFATYTGKASRVLYNKLQDNKALYPGDHIGTLHSLLYSPITNSDNQIIAWERKSNEKFDYQLIVIDEASMLNQGIWQDVQSFNVPILAVGDHGQLPPIEGSFNLMDNPQLRLEEIFRQQADNPVIRLSSWAREKGYIPVGRYSKGVRKLDRSDSETQEFLGELFAQFNENTLVLTGYNHTRVKINQAIRGLLGFESELPMRNDRVICLKNNREQGIYNGMLGYIQDITNIEDTEMPHYLMDVIFDGEDKVRELKVSKTQFGQKETIKDQLPKELQLFDFGYAITVHKAQGSQAERVIVFEERFAKMSDEDWRRWLYTAVTRSSSELYVVGD